MTTPVPTQFSADELALLDERLGQLRPAARRRICDALAALANC